MIRIVKEVDAVADDPKVAVDFNRVGQSLGPLLFRQPFRYGNQHRNNNTQVMLTI